MVLSTTSEKPSGILSHSSYTIPPTGHVDVEARLFEGVSLRTCGSLSWKTMEQPGSLRPEEGFQLHCQGCRLAECLLAFEGKFLFIQASNCLDKANPSYGM